jgi:hypothetical protein
MTRSEQERTSRPWPFWLLRQIVADDSESFEDLIWSVGGSPPYGGVSYDEAAAVFELLEDFRGPSQASDASYSKVESFIEDRPECLHALDAFRINDTIVSSPETYSMDSVQRGADLAEALDHDGLRAVFQAYEAGILIREEDEEGARDLTMDALKRLLPLAAEDTVYSRRVAQLAQNAVALTTRTGDVDTARKLQEQLSDVLDPSLLAEEGLQ